MQEKEETHSFGLEQLQITHGHVPQTGEDHKSKGKKGKHAGAKGTKKMGSVKGTKGKGKKKKGGEEESDWENLSEDFDVHSVGDMGSPSAKERGDMLLQVSGETEVLKGGGGLFRTEAEIRQAEMRRRYGKKGKPDSSDEDNVRKKGTVPPGKRNQGRKGLSGKPVPQSLGIPPRHQRFLAAAGANNFTTLEETLNTEVPVSVRAVIKDLKSEPQLRQVLQAFMERLEATTLEPILRDLRKCFRKVGDNRQVSAWRVFKDSELLVDDVGVFDPRDYPTTDHRSAALQRQHISSAQILLRAARKPTWLEQYVVLRINMLCTVWERNSRR